MNRRINNLSALAIAAAVVAATTGVVGGQIGFAQNAQPAVQAAAQPRSSVEPRYNELPNFNEVKKHLYRGRPAGKNGMKRLARLGIKTVIDFRGEVDLSRKEEADAKAAGIRYFSIPIPGVKASRATNRSRG